MTADPGLRRVNPPGLSRPRGFSHAVVGSGTVVFLAGQTALDSHGEIAGDGVVAQFDVALTNLLAALSAAGGRPDQLASVTGYVTDLAGYRASAAEIGGVWHRLVGRAYPAMAVVEVARLWDAAALVELQGLAVL